MSNIHSSCLDLRYPEPGHLTITRTLPEVKKVLFVTAWTWSLAFRMYNIHCIPLISLIPYFRFSGNDQCHLMYGYGWTHYMGEVRLFFINASMITIKAGHRFETVWFKCYIL